MSAEKTTADCDSNQRNCLKQEEKSPGGEDYSDEIRISRQIVGNYVAATDPRDSWGQRHYRPIKHCASPVEACRIICVVARIWFRL